MEVNKGKASLHWINYFLQH